MDGPRPEWPQTGQDLTNPEAPASIGRVAPKWDCEQSMHRGTGVLCCSFGSPVLVSSEVETQSGVPRKVKAVERQSGVIS